MNYREQKTLNDKRDRVIDLARQLAEMNDSVIITPQSEPHEKFFARVSGLMLTCTVLTMAVRDYDALKAELEGDDDQ